MKEPMSEAGLGWLLDHHGHGEGREGEGVAGGWEETQGFLSEGLCCLSEDETAHLLRGRGRGPGEGRQKVEGGERSH